VQDTKPDSFVVEVFEGCESVGLLSYRFIDVINSPIALAIRDSHWRDQASGATGLVRGVVQWFFLVGSYPDTQAWP